MYPKNLNEKLDFLQTEGKRLLESGSGTEDDWFAAKVWYSSVRDALQSALPKESALFKKFNEIDSPDDVSSDDDTSDSERKRANTDFIERMIHRTDIILDYARLEIAPMPQTKTTKEIIEEHEHHIQEVEREVRSRISEAYFRSWWFRIPIIILVITIFFAATGAIKISDYALNVQDITDKAIERAKQDIEVQAAGILKDLQKHSEAEKNRITIAANNHIETLKQQETPDVDKALSDITMNIDNLDLRLASIEDKASNLNSRLLPLEKALIVIDQGTNRGFVEDAGYIFYSSTIALWAVVGLALLAFLLSLLSLWKMRKR